MDNNLPIEMITIDCLYIISTILSRNCSISNPRADDLHNDLKLVYFMFNDY